MTQNKVALVLSSGGTRGYAHIGAIEVLEARGYHITSVAGTSMGALVGGMYCAGKLNEVCNWLYKLERRDVLALVDWSLGMNHLVKGEKIMEKLREIVPDVRIEDLPIPFRAVASDLETQREVVFSKRSLYRALRASISIPSLFKPVRIGRHVLVDGGIANPLPLNRVTRQPGDLLVSVNVSAPASERVEQLRQQARIQRHPRLLSLDNLIKPLTPDGVDSNYLTLLTAAVTMLIQRNTVLSQKITPPDIAVNIPMNRFSVFDFDHAERIVRAGREAMEQALNQWEARTTPANANPVPTATTLS